MTYELVALAELGRSYVSICGVPLRYLWNDHIRHLKTINTTKAFARISAEDLSSIYLILDNRFVRVDVTQNHRVENCMIIVEEDFWHVEWGKFHRVGKSYRRFNEKQQHFKVVRPKISNLTLSKTY